MAAPIRPAGITPVSTIRRGNANDESRAGGAMRRLASNIAERVAREFRLLDDHGQQRGQDQPFREGEDLYAVNTVARELADELQARPSEQGTLARSLDDFAQESVSLMAARPEAASLDTIARTIAANQPSGQPETVDSAVVHIDQTTRDISGFRPG